jgi:DNA-binding CsgD family transcriptional regulator
MKDLPEVVEYNESLRKNASIPLLICFECYTLWQFGIILFSSHFFSFMQANHFFSGKSFGIIMIAGGIVSVLILFVIPRQFSIVARTVLFVSVAATIAQFTPVNSLVLSVCFQIEAFCSMIIFGCSFAVTIFFLSKEAALMQSAVTNLFPGLLIACIYSDFIKIPFAIYTAVSLVAQCALLFAYHFVPAVLPVHFVNSSSIIKKTYSPAFEICALVFMSAFIMEMALSSAGAVRGGLSVLYISVIPGALFYLFFLRKKKVSPYRLFTSFLTFLCCGFVMRLASVHVGFLAIPSCVIIGFSFMFFSIVAYFGQTVFRIYPSRFVVSGFMFFVTLAIAVHGGAIRLFRTKQKELLILYCLVAALMILVWILIDSSHNRFLQMFKRDENSEVIKKRDSMVKDGCLKTDPLSVLSAREREVAHLLLRGYSSTEIGKLLCISRNTVDTHRKEIYLKLEIHSKRELFFLAETDEQ